MVLATFSSCKKDEDSSPNTGGGNASSTIPTTLVGVWEIANQDIPIQSLRDTYSKLSFTVNSNDAYSLKYHNKNGNITEFTGMVVVSNPDVKHSNGQPIMNIDIVVQKINGQPSPGGWKGIYAFETGNILKLNIEPNVGGISPPVASQGFGSGSSGSEGIYNYKKQ